MARIPEQEIERMRSLFLAVTMPSGEQAGETAQWGTRDRRHL